MRKSGGFGLGRSLGVAAGASAVVLAGPAGLAAAACTGSTGPGSVSEPTSRVRVDGPKVLVLPAAGAEKFGLTVTNKGREFVARYRFRLGGGEVGATKARIEMGTGAGYVPLPVQGAAGSRTFTSEPQAFRVGATRPGFRITTPAGSPPQRLALEATLVEGPLDAGASLRVPVFVANPKMLPAGRSTLPATLTRGTFHEFAVTVTNRSTASLSDVRLGLGLGGGVDKEMDREPFLLPRHVRVEQRTAAGWQRLKVVEGCDITFSARLAGTFDLAAGASKRIPLRIKLSAPTPAKIKFGMYGVSAQARELQGGQDVLNGTFAVRAPVAGADRDGSARVAPPAGTDRPAGTAPGGLADTGSSTVPLTAGLGLLAAGAAAVAVSRRRARG